MRLVLVNPPKCGEGEVNEVAPPLGLLTLALRARAAGVTVAVEDFNLLYHLLPALRTDFYDIATQRLLDLDGDVYGFTSMAVDSHIALELARRVKRARPHVEAIFGGPHFSTLREELPRFFSWVDAVIPGEGEVAFEDFLQRHIGNRALPVPNQRAVPSGHALYSLAPLPAYFAVNPTRTVNFEAGRGCRYKCTFCYSPGFYRAVRDYGAASIVEEFATLHDLGVERVFVVGDNFINDPAWAVRLCEQLEEARLGMSWACYLTLPDLTEDMATRLGRAGCSQAFMGIDVVGRTAEKTFHKRFLRSAAECGRKLRALRNGGVQPTCGFILSPPSHPASSDSEATLAAAVRARLEGADVVMNALTLYTGTESYRRNPVQLESDPLQVQLLMDVPPVVAENPLSAVTPSVFPFHARYTGGEEWRDFLFFCHAAHTLVNTFPEALHAASARGDLSLSKIIRDVLTITGDLMALPVHDRRQAEQEAGIDVLARSASGGRINGEECVRRCVERRKPSSRNVAQTVW